MESKDIEIEDIGKIKFIMSRKAKHVNIKFKPFQGIFVSVPIGFSFKKAEKIVEKQIPWIKEKQKVINKIEEKQTIFDEKTIYKTKFHQLKIIKHNKPLSAERTEDELIIKFSHEADIKNPVNQKQIIYMLEQTLRVEAKKYLPERTEELAKKYNFNFKKVFVKNVKTRWGSCSGVNNINLNIHLMRLPDELIDYIILHELAHTVEKNHSKNFWKLLDSLTGDAKTIDKKLKKYRLDLY
jgi:predicted metal-dependent hydrolase